MIAEPPSTKSRTAPCTAGYLRSPMTRALIFPPRSSAPITTVLPCPPCIPMPSLRRRRFALVHIAGFAADVGFINLDRPIGSAKFAAFLVILHCQPDAMQHEPSRLLSNFHIACNLVTADAILAVSDHPHRHEPLVERNGGIFHDGADFDGELAFGVMFGASPSAPFLAKFHSLAAARRANDFAIRPATEG